MPKKASSKMPPRRRNGTRSKPAKKQPKKVITVKNPINPDDSVWQIELLDIGEGEFLDLWTRGSDRIGFNPSEKAIYDKTKLIARIAKEVRLAQRAVLEEE